MRLLVSAQKAFFSAPCIQKYSCLSEYISCTLQLVQTQPRIVTWQGVFPRRQNTMRLFSGAHSGYELHLSHLQYLSSVVGNLPPPSMARIAD